MDKLTLLRNGQPELGNDLPGNGFCQLAMIGSGGNGKTHVDFRNVPIRTARWQSRRYPLRYVFAQLPPLIGIQAGNPHHQFVNLNHRPFML
jgi:hypothetical protein